LKLKKLLNILQAIEVHTKFKDELIDLNLIHNYKFFNELGINKR